MSHRDHLRTVAAEERCGFCRAKWTFLRILSPAGTLVPACPEHLETVAETLWEGFTPKAEARR